MTINIFDCRILQKFLEYAYKPKMGFYNLFKIQQQDHLRSNLIDIDIREGTRGISQVTNPDAEANIVDRLGFVTKTVKPPYIKEKIKYSPAQFFHRMPGEKIYSDKALMHIIQQQQERDVTQLKERLERYKEYYLIRALVGGGAVTYRGDGIDYSYDFNFPAANIVTLTSTAKWDDHANSTPLNDIQDWILQATKTGGATPDMIIMGFTAAEHYQANAQVIAALDNRRMDVGFIEAVKKDNGLMYMGSTKFNIPIYCYAEYYTSPSTGSEIAAFPEDKVLVTSSKALITEHYAPILHMGAYWGEPLAVSSVYGGGFINAKGGLLRVFPRVYVENNTGKAWLEVQSSCLIVPTDARCHVIATVY